MEEADLTISDRLDPGRAAMLWTILGLSCPDLPHRSQPDQGDLLPAMAHHIYFWRAPLAEASTKIATAGKLRIHAPLRFGIGADLSCSGAGQIAVHQRGALALSEVTSFGTFPTTDAQTQRRLDADARHQISFPPELCFAFAALSFDANPVHFDRAGAAAQGFDRPVVAPRFLALHLAALAEAHLGPVAAFDYRCQGALFEGDRAVIAIRGKDLWVEGPGARTVMTARAG